MFKAACLVILGLFAVANAVPSTYDTEHVWVNGNVSYPFPSNSLIGGFDPYGYYIYVGRVIYSGSVLPARVVAETGTAYFNTENVSNKVVNGYQLLSTQPDMDYYWVRSFDGFLEDRAIAVGTSVYNERVYCCRAKADGGLLFGTLLLSRKMCIIKNDDLPLRQFDKYEVLVAKPKVNGTHY